MSEARPYPPPPPPPPPPKSRKWLVRLLVFLLLLSLLFNFAQTVAFQEYAAGEKPYEKFHSGELTANDKIARLEISGVIMPPYTERWLKAIKKISEDKSVKGVVLIIDSPGGLVADSHQIYHRLQKLAEQKPIVVSMKRLAASGGYYVAMGAGPKAKIFVEPTTWVGSIGVIVPRYDVSQLADKWGIKSEPLVTGPLKNSLDPLNPMKPEEEAVWRVIIDDAFSRFVQVIDGGRDKLDEAAIRKLATGQIYTAKQGLENGLVDVLGYDDDATEDLKAQLGLKSARVVEYQFPSSLFDVLSAKSDAPSQASFDPLKRLFEANVPRAMYLFGWRPGMATESMH
jgi:protease-4